MNEPNQPGESGRGVSTGLVLAMGSMIALAPLTVDTYLPALPAIQRDLGTTPGAVQLTLTGTLLGLALGQVVIGPLSDLFGRRRPLLAGAALHVVASLLIALAPTIAVLGALRVLLMLVMGVAPVLAPTLGSQVLRFSSWHGVFVMLAGIGLVLLGLAVAYLPETLPSGAGAGGAAVEPDGGRRRAERSRPSSLRRVGDRRAGGCVTMGRVSPPSSAVVASAVVDALVALGVRDVVLCPGSRSAPLAYALASSSSLGGLRLNVRLDERTAGFVALGAALASGVPAAVVTTSGTATANLHPAVLEADAAGVPLIVLTADRPHELRGIGANQVTDQVKLFGPAVRWFGELPAGADATSVRQQVSRAVAAARGSLRGDAGPVQVNIAFADPLTPGAETPAPGSTGLTRVEAALEPVPVRIPAGPRTVVLAGHSAGATPLVVARAAGWPLLAEPASGARMEDAVGPYRLLLDHPALGGRVQRVLLYGRPTLSRAVSRLIARDDVEVVVVSDRPSWADPSGRASRVVPAVDPPLAGTGPGAGDDAAWLDAWLSAGEAAARAIDEVLNGELAAGVMTGPSVARSVAAATGPGDVLVAGSSNPIRDLDLVAPALPGSVRWVAGRRVVVEGAGRVLANRGLAGIDGTVSTALGVALASSGPASSGRVRALLGDLTLLHDMGGLLSGVHEPVPTLQLVVVDDAGGGIFGLLEHGARSLRGPAEKAVYERFFATPQGVDLAALCAGYGVAHRCPDDAAGLRAALTDPPAGLSVVQVRVDRERERDLADHLAAAARAALDPSLEPLP